MTTTLLDERLTDADEAAIALAIEMERAVNPKEIASMLCDRTREEVGTFAVGRRQIDLLRDRSRGNVPRFGRGSSTILPTTGVIGGARSSCSGACSKRGVSRFHPDPMAAIEAAEQAESRR